jgi:hypothetical protein
MYCGLHFLFRRHSSNTLYLVKIMKDNLVSQIVATPVVVASYSESKTRSDKYLGHVVLFFTSGT